MYNAQQNRTNTNTNIEKTVRNISGSPIIRGYKGQTLTLNDDLDVLRLKRQITRLETIIENAGIAGSGNSTTITGFTHTSTMPDYRGVNEDHDNRYLKVFPLLSANGELLVDSDNKIVCIDAR